MIKRKNKENRVCQFCSNKKTAIFEKVKNHEFVCLCVQ